MQFLKILFWALVAFVAAVFTFGNWKWVPIWLFGNLVAEVNLPLLLFVTFLAGFLPTLLYQRTIRWRLRQRLAVAERTAADLRTLSPAGSVVPPVAAAPISTAPPVISPSESA
jgi:putative membrane protein